MNEIEEEQKIEISFLNEFGDGKTDEDKIVQDLVFTCEEGINYRKL
ncbi:hypothetical protein [Sulfurimonas sp.]